MSLKENLKKKIQIQRLTKRVAQSFAVREGSKKIDKETMRQLLALSPFVGEHRRDLELYFRRLAGETGEVLVLDNELPLYGKTTLDDVALRRSPEIKEMVSIRNIIKILNDSDILICKGREALLYVQDRSLEGLDLRYDRKDLEQMAKEGLDAFAGADSEGVTEILELFVELLGYGPVPAEVTVNDWRMHGPSPTETGDVESVGPVLMYNEKTNTLRLIKRKIPLEVQTKDLIPAVALGETAPDEEGYGVFQFLVEAALQKKPPTIH